MSRESPRTDALLDKLYEILPAPNQRSLAAALGVSVGYISVLLSHLRRHANRYGWTVPHVRRGPNTDDSQRFFAVREDRGEGYILDDTHENRLYLRQGALSTVKHISSSMSNEAAALDLAAIHTRSRNLRLELEDLAELSRFLQKRADRLAERLDGTDD